jgi:hypothetical protein
MGGSLRGHPVTEMCYSAKDSEFFADKSLDCVFRPSNYQMQGQGLHGKSPTYQARKTISRRAAASGQGLPPTPPYEDHYV